MFHEITENTITHGHLSKYDFIKEKEKKGPALIIFPYYEQCQKAASYDLTPTIVAMSSKIGMLETVYRENHYGKDRYYIYVHPKDTVMLISNEHITVPPNIAGYISSRVSKVVEGFGHISTTIDPNWTGAVLIALSNPSNQMLKIYVGMSSLPDTSDDQWEAPNQLATVTFHYLNTPCMASDKESYHEGMRLDLLEQLCYRNRSGFKAFWRNLIHFRRKAFTDYFFTAIQPLEHGFTEERWKGFLADFSYLTKVPPTKQKFVSPKSQKIAKNFIITEGIFTRILHFLQKHKTKMLFLLVFLLFCLLQLHLLPENFFESAVQVIGQVP